MIEKEPVYYMLTSTEPEIQLNVRRWSQVYVMIKGDPVNRPSIEIDRGTIMNDQIEWRHRAGSLKRVTDTKDVVVETYGCDWVKIHLTRGSQCELVVARVDQVR